MNLLNKLIKESYQLFSSYELGAVMAVCDCNCCLLEQTERTLRTQPLHELSTDAVYDYLDSCASGTEESLINQIRYLLPRILELLSLGETLRYEMHYTLDKLHCDNFIWLPAEIDFLQRFSTAYFASQISEPIYQLESIIDMFEIAHLPTTLIDRLCEVMIKRCNEFDVIDNTMMTCSQNVFSNDASVETNERFKVLTSSDDFKNAFITAILNKIENENLTQDEINTCEIAFDVFSGL